LYRSEQGWSQERLALESGLNRTYLSAVERGEQNISLDNIYRLAVAMNVEAWVLLKNDLQRLP
jgi:transcriptional regulator with XRE-family HTH domain